MPLSRSRAYVNLVMTENKEQVWMPLVRLLLRSRSPRGLHKRGCGRQILLVARGGTGIGTGRGLGSLTANPCEPFCGRLVGNGYSSAGWGFAPGGPAGCCWAVCPQPMLPMVPVALDR
jgi:hypothetical protein